MLLKSLKVCIQESIKNLEMSTELEKRLLIPDKTYVAQKDETEYWDYKEDIDLNNPFDIAKLAKFILGFHNSKGGVLIYGVSDNNWQVVGIEEHKMLDTKMLKDKVNKYTGRDINIFQHRIPTIHNKKFIWLIFIPPKQDKNPVACKNNGPDDPNKKVPVIKKNQYFIRIGDELKTCIDPNDYERLFIGVSFKNLHAYSYEVDTEYLRLLEPHYSQFIGRKQLIKEVREALSPDSRSYIIALEGVGGVGKSALAIEIVRMLYKANSYQFIVSLSAKNKVWHIHTKSRQAEFSGFTELITEVAKVLDIPTVNKDPENIEQEVLNIMKGEEGLLFIDNIEEIEDSRVYDFFKKIPNPVKVLLTTRIRRYFNLPVEAISVSAMNEEEAKELFILELQRVGYHNYINELKEMEVIVKATGCLPLAIKWSASLAANCSSLKEVSTKIRSRNVNAGKQEFLNFCYKTMYDSLSDTGREVAMLCPYLGDDWNIYILSFLLNKSEEQIEIAIDELENQGLLSRTSHSGGFSMLPLTMDFLLHEYSKNIPFKEKVERGSIKLSRSTQGNIFSLPVEDKIMAFYEEAKKLEQDAQYKQALKYITIALQYIWKNSWENKEDLLAKLKFLQGKVIYLSASKSQGIKIMLNALKNTSNEASKSPEDEMFLAEALLLHGESKYEDEALLKIVKYIGIAKNVSPELIQKFCRKTSRHKNYVLLRQFIERTQNEDYAYWLAKAIGIDLHNQELKNSLGDALRALFKLASESDLAKSEEKNTFNKWATQLKV